MLPIKALCWICLLTVFQTTLCFAIERDTSRVWDPERFRDTVEDFIVAKDNSIWIAQNRRITRFSFNDGYTHYSYRDGLSEGEIDLIIEDNNGIIWCFGEHEDQAVASTFDGQTWATVTHLPEPFKDQPDIGYSILFDQNNYLWIGTGDGSLATYTDPARGGLGLFHYNGQNWTQYTYQNGLVHNTVLDLEETADGSIWVATPEGINRLKDQTWITYTQEQGLATNTTTNLYDMPNGELWAVHDLGMSIFDASSQSKLWHPAKNTDVPFKDIYEKLHTANDEIWFDTSDGPGPIRYSHNGWMRFPPETGFPEDVDAMVQDANGSYWILYDERVTLNNILVQFVPNYPQPVTIQGTISHKNNGSPWAHAAVRIDDQEGDLQAWTKTDANGHYQIQVFKTSIESTKDSNTYRISVVNSNDNAEIDLADTNLKIVNLSAEETQPPLDTKPITFFILVVGFTIIWFLKNKWSPTLLSTF